MKTLFPRVLVGLGFACASFMRPALAAPPTQLSSRGIGGGGGIYSPVISPHSAQTMFLGCDMSELFYTNDGAQSWSTVDFRQLQNTQATEVQFTSDPQVLYALDYTSAPPYGFPTYERPSRSSDGGVHWTPCSGWQSGRVCYSTYAAWNSTTRVFAADATHLYGSSDSGATFDVVFDATSLGLASGSVRLGGAFFDGNNVWIGSNAGLLYSSNSGDSFSVASVSGLAASEAIIAFIGAKDPSSGAIRFFCVTANAASASGGKLLSAFYFQNPQIYYFDWGGAGWTNIFSNTVRNSIASGDYPVLIAMARNDINTVYVAANRPGGTYPDNNTTYKITSAGGAWQHVFFIPNNQNIATGWGGVPSNGRLDYSYPTGICVDPNNSSRVITCDDALIHMTTNGGTTWQQIYVNAADQNAVNTLISAAKTYRGIGLEPTASYCVDWASASIVLGGFSDMAMIRSIDGGTKWGYPGGFAYDEVLQILHHPTSGVLYACINNMISPYFVLGMNDASIDAARGAIYFSTNNGSSWSVLKPASALGNAAPVWITLDAANDKLYVSTANHTTGGIWRIDNVSLGASAPAPVQLGAPSATRATEGHAFNLRILSHGELVCSYNGRYVGSTPPNQGFSQSSGVFYSTDGGATWSDRSDNPGMRYWTHDVVIDPHDSMENTWYAGVWGTIAFTPGNPNPNTLGGLYKTIDRGLHWTRIYSTDSVTSVTINPSPSHSNEMYVCTRQSGLLFTSNLRDPNGATFAQIASFPFRQPTHVFFNPYSASELWVASYGNGLRVGTIPAGSVQFSAANFSVTEGSTATITATRTGGDNGAVSVTFATADGTANANADYTSASGSLSWADADTADKNFTVATNIDQVVEGIETVNLSLTSPTNGATLGAPGTAVLSITDSAMDNWRAAQFGGDANNLLIAGDTATPAHDGIPNLIKYALGLNPYAPITGGILTPALENGYLTLSMNRSAQPADVTLSAEVTSDLLTSWLPDTTIITNIATLFKARDNVLMTGNTRRFVHAVVTRH